MKFGKKVLSMLLATGMVMSLAACGGNSDSAATTTDSSDNASAEAASDSAAKRRGKRPSVFLTDSRKPTRSTWDCWSSRNTSRRTLVISIR